MREVRVYRPPGPDSRRLPVMYLLHGGPGTDTDFLNAGLIEQLDGRICGGQRFVVAVPDGSVPPHADGSWWDSEWADDPGGRFDLESFITGPLITAVEGSLRRPAADRAIAGFSMGGFGAAAIGLRHRSLYGSVIGIAGYYTHLDDPDHALGTSVTAQSHHLPKLLLSKVKGQHWFLADGSSDHLPVVEGETQRFAQLLLDKNDDVTMRIVPGAHTIQMVGSALPAAFSWWKSRLPKGAG